MEFSLTDHYQSFGDTCSFQLQDYSTPKMKAVGSSETPTKIYQTTKHYIPQRSTFHSHHPENLKIPENNSEQKYATGYKNIKAEFFTLDSVFNFCFCCEQFSIYQM
jgi:hypothetical protein